MAIQNGPEWQDERPPAPPLPQGSNRRHIDAAHAEALVAALRETHRHIEALEGLSWTPTSLCEARARANEITSLLRRDLIQRTAEATDEYRHKMLEGKGDE